MAVQGIGPFKSIVGLVFLVLASGCAKSREHKDRIVTDSLAQAQASARRASVECVSPDQCHEALALLSIAEPTQTSACTGFLIAPDTLATNSHCIPDDLKYADADCSERLWAFFPQIGSLPNESAKCSRIISLSKLLYKRGPDYAFIKLDRKLSRQPLQMSQEGAPLDGKSHVFKVDPTYDSTVKAFRGLLGRANCRSIESTVLVPYFNHRESPLVTLTDCMLKPGNSGSPFVGSNGEAWAIAQSIIVEDSSELKPIEQHRLKSFAAPLNVATNLSCVHNPALPARDFSAACHVDFVRFQEIPDSLSYLFEQKNIRHPRLLISEAVNSAMGFYFLLDENKSVLESVQWNVEVTERFSDGSLHALASPRCITQNIAGATDISATITIPEWTLTPGTNIYYQLGYVAVDSGHRRTVDLSSLPLCSVATATN